MQSFSVSLPFQADDDRLVMSEERGLLLSGSPQVTVPYGVIAEVLVGLWRC